MTIFSTFLIDNNGNIQMLKKKKGKKEIKYK